MKFSMQPQSRALMFPRAESAQVELILTRHDGTPWVLSMSAGIERFVGRFPRLPRLLIDGPLLSYRSPYPGS